MGWDEKFLQDAVDTCRNPSGKIEDCSLFTLQPSSVYGNCAIKEPQSLVNEKVINGLNSLPGNPAIVAGPEYAKGTVAGGPGSNNNPSPDAPAAAAPAAAAPPSSQPAD